MKIKLDGYNDCGKCSFGTLLEEFDTDYDKIFYKKQEVKIEKVEDLFPFLWQHAGITIRDGFKKLSYFYDKGTWWHQIYDLDIKKTDEKIVYYIRKLKKEKDPDKKEKIIKEIRLEQAHINCFLKYMDDIDKRMFEIQKKLIEVNNGI